ncbi:hypothetical protein PPL_05987 [Heterostelium album PN500]|uniref:Uncharacterized protein n=1 Tax=Heterostelium pallidum (strain ATCC 26659 / Pp 5 / PN500) TaxID=670386 RepID=D3BBW7_HETP5|nr:hypothetical protein PPL_05987 [Heterostelium album PN500]EFA81150.1 hypothetical protein PPL_05987 [Heterostelium album PN500]|eukprot:XP_020433268.1 hypothetical protein PPL_05987 [Heterostelium album PN500]
MSSLNTEEDNSNFSGCVDCQYKLSFKPFVWDKTHSGGWISGSCAHSTIHVSDPLTEFYTFEPNVQTNLDKKWFSENQIELEELEIEGPDNKCSKEKNVSVTLKHDKTDRYILTVKHN